MSEASSAIIIRKAHPADVPTLIGLIRELAEYEHLLPEVKVTPEIMTESLFGPRPVAEALLMERGGEPAGYCMYFYNFSTFLGRPGIYVEDIYVRPPFRRQGIGQAVFNYLARLAKENDYPRLEFAVLDWNEPALNFYQQMGAGPLKDWRLFRFTGEALARLGAGPDRKSIV